jgi:CYTH domain-containing protein/predicted ATPase
LLGHGSFGEVWLAERASGIARTRLAVKLPVGVAADLDSIRHEAEVQVRAGNHPNVLPIFEADIYDGQVVLVSEYAPDGSLAGWLARQGGRAPSVESAVVMISGVLAGLEHLHARDIIHRDIKPANILLQNEVPRLADFGIARLLGDPGATGHAAGTPRYMAPEAFDGVRSVQTDLWSVGVLLYELLAGRLPFPDHDWTALIKAVVTQPPEPLPDSVPASVRGIVHRALEKDPARRFPSAREMRLAVQEALRSLQFTALASRMGENAPVYRLVLTGGPCGGKTTALSRIAERMESLGFQVYQVPEAATLLLGGGVSVRDLSSTGLIELQQNVLRVMMALEDAFHALARSSGRPSIILCDRGVMDAAAYLPADAWTALLDEHDWTTVGLRDKRYEAVFHLVTAADGAEAFYTTANNAVRTETPEQARLLDARTREAWIGHPHLRIIGNSTNFEHKVQRVVAAVCNVVGVPEPREIERKFLVSHSPKPAEMPVPFGEFDIEQTYLVSEPGQEMRVRRRGQHGSYTYTHTTKRPAGSGQRVEIERQISGREYVALLAQADPARRTIRKRRRVFLWLNQYFELDTFLDPRPGLEILELEMDDLTTPVQIPPFLAIEREVTEDPRYANHQLALASGT